MSLIVGQLGYALVSAMTAWHEGKLAIEHWIALDHDLLHLVAGAALWFALVRLTRRPMTSWLPWLGLFAIIAWNEAVDLASEQWHDPLQQYGEGVRDLAVTMIVPTLLLLAARMSRARPHRAPPSRT